MISGTPYGPQGVGRAGPSVQIGRSGPLLSGPDTFRAGDVRPRFESAIRAGRNGFVVRAGRVGGGRLVVEWVTCATTPRTLGGTDARRAIGKSCRAAQWARNTDMPCAADWQH